MSYNTLFSPIKMGRISLKNRIAMSPLTSNFASENGFVTEKLKGWYRTRAEGGTGLIIVEGAVVSPEGKGAPQQLMVHSDEYVPGLQELATEIHRAGAKAFLQLIHMGRWANAQLTSLQPVAPSPIPSASKKNEYPQELTSTQIAKLVNSFANAALRAEKAGFDGIEIHAAHSYLITSFLSPLSNIRTDKYGGDLESRCRFLLEIVREIKKRITKSDFNIIVRLSAEEGLSNGFNISDALYLVRKLAEVPINGIVVSSGVQEAPYLISPMGDTSEGVNADFASIIRKEVGIFTMVVCRIRTPQAAESIISNHQADMVVLGRALIADPDWTRKAMTDRADSIRYCISCNICAGRRSRPEIRCSVNPFAGKESSWVIKPRKNNLRLLIVGSSWAALEAARIAALRGIKTTLVEPNPWLGGVGALRSQVPIQHEISDVIQYWKQELEKLQVEIFVGTQPDKVLNENIFDVGLIALSATPISPDLNPPENLSKYTAIDVLSAKDLSGIDNILVEGDTLLAAETAMYLGNIGKKVHLIVKGDRVARNTSITYRHSILKELKKYQVKVDMEVTSINFKDGQAWLTHVNKKVSQLSNIQVLIVEDEYSSKEAYADKLKAMIPQVHVIGDAYNPDVMTDLMEKAADVVINL